MNHSSTPQPVPEQAVKYYMTISLNVLNHLGLNLYSNTPAVLAEVIANSWDADATQVDVVFDIEKRPSPSLIMVAE